jgi:hypothetical protein
MSFERYARDGWLLEADTRRRRGRAVGRAARARWEVTARAAEGLEGFEAWGATVDGRLAATLMAARIDDCVIYLSQQSLRELWETHANQALTFHVTRTVAARPGVRAIHYGLQSLDAPPTLDDFKCHLGFVRRPVRHHVEFHPLLAPLVNRTTHALLRRAHAGWPASAFLSKGEGLARVYLEGRRRRARVSPGEQLGRSHA